MWCGVRSYDEVVSIWDKRMMTGRAQPVAQLGTEGGGVWRIKWHPYDPKLFVVAAMHRGFFVMRWTEGSGTRDSHLKPPSRSSSAPTDD
jgi:diphthamide biosynthesis protein 7